MLLCVCHNWSDKRDVDIETFGIRLKVLLKLKIQVLITDQTLPSIAVATV